MKIPTLYKLSIIFFSISLFATSTQGMEATAIADCQGHFSATDSQGLPQDVELKFKVLRKDSAVIVMVDQIHPRFGQPTQSIRQVQERITHDFWEYTNNFDFTLLILPADKGRFSGNLLGVRYLNVPLQCWFAR